ncbi:DUF5819 family protein [Promicromonospora sukumoe]|uniref:DUF5819 family protein n=1 Tax=Promicromonospora sukumoe TaxID=88382 RepID=UPI00364781EF
MTSTPGETRAPAVSGRVRALVVVVWVLLLAHLAATLLWAAPGYLTGRPEGESAGDPPSAPVHRALEPYMTPVFAQNWSVFAPEPLHVEYTLRVRGVYDVGPDGALVPGPWIDTTAVEVRALTGHLLPAATDRPSRRLASDLRTAFLALPEDERATVLVSPVRGSEGPGGAGSGEPDGAGAGDAGPGDAGADGGTDGAGSGDTGPWPALRDTLLDAGGAPDVVDDYLGLDRAAAAYATQVLRASGDSAVPQPGSGAPGSGADLVYVQVSVVRQALAPQGTSERPASTELLLGARPPVVVPGQDDAAFSGTWAALLGAGRTP